MNLNCSLLEKTSKKGNTYICLEIQITPTFKKVVFLEGAEVELARQLLAQNDMPDFLK